jgi:hypothetical protein
MLSFLPVTYFMTIGGYLLWYKYTTVLILAAVQEEVVFLL